jgi:hypothetical protein
LALSDVVLGSVLIGLAVFDLRPQESLWYYGVSTVLILTHIWRTVDYLGPRENAFCANTPLFVLNNIRLGLTAGGLGFSLLLKI